MSVDPYGRDRRVGRWYAQPSRMFRHYDVVKLIQDQVLVLYATYSPRVDCTEFIGICDRFEIVPEGCETPLYEPIVTGKTVEWRKVSS